MPPKKRPSASADSGSAAKKAKTSNGGGPKKGKTVFVDIDETICTYDGPRPPFPYSKARPLQDRIDIVNKWYDAGHHIVLWTARGSKSGIDHSEMTAKQMTEWGVKHHELRCDKPHYDVFIDDRALNAHYAKWDLDGIRNFRTEALVKVNGAFPREKVYKIPPKLTTDAEKTKFALSSYLAFQYVAEPGVGFRPHLIPKYWEEYQYCPRNNPIKTGPEAAAKLRSLVDGYVAKYGQDKIGCLLSGGIDSASVAGCLPPGTKAYSVKFSDSKTTEDETLQARVFADAAGLDFRVVQVTWADYETHMEELMLKKLQPLHPSEIAVYMACKQAKADGCEAMMAGWGCDVHFGGMDKLQSKEWTLGTFEPRFTYTPPARVLKDPMSMTPWFAKYAPGGKPYDLQEFLNWNYHSMTLACFYYLPEMLNMPMICPWGEIELEGGIDLARVRGGDPKYVVREAFELILPNVKPTAKVPFVRPSEQYTSSWPGPTRPEFLPNLDMTQFTGQQRWMMFILEKFLNLIDKVAVSSD